VQLLVAAALQHLPHQAACKASPVLPPYCPALQGTEAIREAVLTTWADFLDSPDVATKAINFAAVNWPVEQAGCRYRGTTWRVPRTALGAVPGATARMASATLKTSHCSVCPLPFFSTSVERSQCTWRPACGLATALR